MLANLEKTAMDKLPLQVCKNPFKKSAQLSFSRPICWTFCKLYAKDQTEGLGLSRDSQS